MEPIETADRATGEGAEEYHDFAGEGGEAGETDRGHGCEPEEEAEFRGDTREAPQFGEFEGASAAVDFPAKGEEGGHGEPVGEEHERHAGEAELVEGDEAQEGVAHVHHAGVTEQEVEPLLREGDEADVENVAEEQNENEVGKLLDFFGEDWDGEAEEAVESEFFEHAGVEHGGGGRGGGIGFRRPGVEREEGDEDAEAEKKEQVDDGSGGQDAGVAELLEKADVKGAQAFGHGEPETNESEKENEAAEGEVNRHFPSDALAVTRTPDADEEEGGNEGKLVESVEEKEVDRSKGADGTARDQEKARVEHARGLFHLRGDPDRGEGDERGQQEEDHAQPVGPERKAEAVSGEERVFADKLEAADLEIVGREEVEAEKEVGPGAEERDAAWSGTSHAESRGDQRDKDEGEERAHHRKTRK